VEAEVILKKLDRQFRKLTKFHTRYSAVDLENTLTLKITTADKRGCSIDPTKGGMEATLSFPTISLRSNRGIGTISKLICSTIARTKG
jgi:hypothetical protein